MQTLIQTLITSDAAVQAALRYLTDKKALHKLATPVPVMGTSLCIYHNNTYSDERNKATLKPLTV